MQEELRRCNTIGDTSGIFHFTDIILSDHPVTQRLAKGRCLFVNNMRINFDAALAFFQYLGLVERVDAEKIYSSELGIELSKKDKQEFQETLCRLCFQKILKEDILHLDAVKYDLQRDCYIIKNYGFSLEAAVFRNFLIQFHALQEYGGVFEIDKKYEGIFSSLQKEVRRKITLNELKKKLERNEIHGALAEEFVLEYEKSRIANPSLSSRIKQISIIDVTAGFDIVSFQNDESTEYDRFIEVKSYSGELHFYWSRNEIETARLYGERYCLYLVDISRINERDYAPVIISNPADHVLHSENWIVNPMSYQVLPIKTE